MFTLAAFSAYYTLFNDVVLCMYVLVRGTFKRNLGEVVWCL
jgi:hypothetical protein